MKKRIFALVLTAISLLGSAGAEYYTSNEDVYFHAKTDCVAGSTFEISEEAAIQFEKLACPVCVERTSVTGELIEIDLPEGYASLKNVDFKDGKLLVCGCVNVQNSKPWMAMVDLSGNKLQESLGKPNDQMIREAKFLSDGKIAAIRSLGVGEGDCLELYKDGKLVHRFEAMHLLRKIWPMEDGFLVYGSPEMYEYHLAKLDNDGSMLWVRDLTELFPLSDQQPGLSGVLLGEGVHVVWGRTAVSDMEDRPVIAAFDDGGNILGQMEVSKVSGQHSKTLYDKNMQPTGWEMADSYLQSLGKAAWTEGGVIFTAGGAKPGSAIKFGPEGEIWYEHFGYLFDENQEIILDGKIADSGAIEDMIPWQDGYLLAMGAYAQSEITYATEKSYIRMAQMNAEGKIIRDWFEEIGDILYTEAVSLMQDGEDVHLLVYGQTMDDMLAYEKGMTQPQIPRKMILKKINV